MRQFGTILLTFLAQVGGGPGPRENNLVRFGLAAVFWMVLLGVAWNRQRRDHLPRERLLVWGFALGLVREVFMFTHVAMHVLDVSWPIRALEVEPLEHGLSIAAIVMVAGAFMRYLSDDAPLSRRYLQVGVVATALSYGAARWMWGGLASANPEIRFNMTWGGVIIHAVAAILIVAAIILLARQRGWVRNVVILALTFLLIDEGIRLLNFATAKAYSPVVCPIGNNLHIWSIPLLGYVYFREQAIEKRKAEEALADYREHLEELIAERTLDLSAQNAIAATISRSLHLDEILSTSLDTALRVLDMDIGCIFLSDRENKELTLQTFRGGTPPEGKGDEDTPCLCRRLSARAVREMAPVVVDVPAHPGGDLPLCAVDDGPHTLVSTPLVAQGRALGALTLSTPKRSGIDAQRLELLKAIGQQIGVAVANARLYLEKERWATELALLHQVSMFLNATLDPGTIYRRLNEQAPKLVDCQVAHIFRWDEEREEAVGVSSTGVDGPGVREIHVSPSENSLLARLTTQRRAVAVEDASDDQRVPPWWREAYGARALLAVPIWGRERPLGFLFLIDQRGPRRWAADEVALVESFVNRAAVALENAYLHQQMEWAAAVEERQRIAADMHDGLAQTLSHMGHRVDRMVELSSAKEMTDVAEEGRQVRDVIDRATRDVRRSIASLQEAPPPRRPLQDWLAEAVSEFAQRSEADAQVVASHRAPLFVPPEHVEQILRVVQEALTNAGRHAGAGTIRVSLETDGGRGVVTVEDDGRGFNPASPAADDDGHFGISIMEARAARIGGGLEIDTRPGLGTRVRLTWPLETREGTEETTYGED